MRDSFKCEYLFLGSCRVRIERDIRFGSESINVPIPEELQKNGEGKVYIPYEYVKSLVVFHPDMAFKGNHAFISYVMVNPTNDRVRNIGELFSTKSKVFGTHQKYDRKSTKETCRTCLK